MQIVNFIALYEAHTNSFNLGTRIFVNNGDWAKCMLYMHVDVHVNVEVGCELSPFVSYLNTVDAGC